MTTPQAQVTIEEAFEIAQKYHETGNLTLADRTYRDILNTVPDSYKANYYLSLIAYQRGDIEEGLSFIEKTLKIKETENDKLEYAWNLYGILLARAGKQEEAIKAWEKAIEIRPDYHEAYCNMGNAYWELGNNEESLKACQKAIDINPEFADGYINLGIAFTTMEKHHEAIEAWTKALELRPRHPNALINIGNASREIGKLHDAEEYTRKGLEIAHDNPQALLNLGNILRDLQQFDESESAYKKAIAVRPDYIDAHNNLAILYMDMMRYEDAITEARYALAFDPDHPQALANLASALRDTGKLTEAEDAARKALKISPDSVEAMIDLADVLYMSDHLDEAETLFNDALEIMPNSARLYLKFSNVLERANRMDEAIECVDKAIEMSPESPDVYHRKAMIYFVSNRIEEALETNDKALEINPNYPIALATKSEILQTSGQMEEALEAARAGLELSNEIPALYFTISKLKKFTADDPDYIRMKELEGQSDSLSKLQNIAIQFAMFKASEDIKDYDNSFKYLKKGNDLKRSTLAFDPDVQQLSFDNYKKAYTKDFLDSCKNTGHKTDAPIFIVGMPRSGTTLTEQIISSHPDVFGAGELYYLSESEKELGFISPKNCENLGKLYMEKARAIDPEAKKALKITDKMPGNFMRIGQIVSTLPDAKIIHCQRNPVDTCLSCYKQLFARGHYWSYNTEELAEHYALYYEMMEHWRQILPGRFLEIKYEDTVSDFENQARKLIDYVGLEWNDACLTPHKTKRSILTASKGQVRKPIYKTSIEAWRRYEEQLQPLADALAPYFPKIESIKQLVFVLRR